LTFTATYMMATCALGLPSPDRTIATLTLIDVGTNLRRLVELATYAEPYQFPSLPHVTVATLRDRFDLWTRFGGWPIICVDSAVFLHLPRFGSVYLRCWYWVFNPLTSLGDNQQQQLGCFCGIFRVAESRIQVHKPGFVRASRSCLLTLLTDTQCRDMPQVSEPISQTKTVPYMHIIHACSLGGL
jgi:hypothetical protein